MSMRQSFIALASSEVEHVVATKATKELMIIKTVQQYWYPTWQFENTM